MSNMEIERKFLVSKEQFEVLQQRARERQQIRQAYLAVDEQREVRLRCIDGKHYRLTIKGKGSLAREEFEVKLTVDQGRQLQPLLEQRSLEKMRYLIPLGHHTIELDYYLGKLEGLLVAEIEFTSETEAAAFEPPQGLGPEISGIASFKNRELVGKSYADLKSLIP